MGIDWEDILGAEGADIQDAYDALVWDSMDTMDQWDSDYEDDDEPDIFEDSEEAEDDEFYEKLQALLCLTGRTLWQAGQLEDYTIIQTSFFDELSKLFPDLAEYLNSQSKQVLVETFDTGPGDLPFDDLELLPF